MKKYIVFSLILFTMTCYGQHVIVNNSLTYSKIYNNYQMLEETVHNYYFGIEATMLERDSKNYYLSMELGVLTKAGQERNFYLNDVRMDLKEKFDYLIFNPSFRYKIPFNSSHIYFGAGPRLDILISKKEFESVVYHDFEAESVIFGSSLEIGAIYDIKGLRFGFQGQYNMDFSKLVNSEFNLKAHTITFGILLGYRLF